MDKIKILFFICSISYCGIHAQNKTSIDSLNSLLSSSLQDTNKVILLSQLSDEYATSNPNKALEYAKLGLQLAKKLNYKNGISLCLNKIGVVYFQKGDYKAAITYYWQALEINEETGNKAGIADNLSNIGTVFRTQQNYKKALEYSLLALKIDVESGNKPAIAASHTNIGNLYFYEKNYSKALEYYQRAIVTFKDLADMQSIATVLNNIGGIYFEQGNYNKAIENFNKAIKIFESIGDKVGIAIDLNNIGEVYYKQGNIEKAIDYFKKSVILSEEIGAKDIMMYNYEGLTELSEKRNNYKEAYRYHKLYSEIKDTLLNAEINKQIDELAIKYETEKKEKENELLRIEANKQYLLNKRQKDMRNYLIIGIAIISIAGLIFFFRSREKEKTNALLKELVAIKIEEENELRKAKEAVEQSMKLKDQFIANMSHEMRTPLNAIIGFSDLLSKRHQGTEENEHIQLIKTAGEDLINIVDDILDMSKMEASIITFTEKPIRIRHLFRSIEALLSQKANEKNLNVAFNCSESVPEVIIGDPTRLTQVFVNLIGNAIKFTEKGNININAVFMREENGNIWLQFSVKDTGIGIPPEKLDLIFDRFAQAEADTTRKYGGTGLGLSIVKYLVELQKGSISVKSELGKGSKFIFTLPFKKVNETPEITINTPNIKLNTNKLKILLAEDNLLNIKLALEIFADSEAEIDVAANGEEAIKLVENYKYNVVLMDMQMPVMDGYQATKYIREKLKNDVPIIALTAHAMAGEKEKCLNLGMTDYMTKPIKADVLFDKINKVTKKTITINLPDKKAEVTRGKLINLNYLAELGMKEEKIKILLQNFYTQMEEEIPLLKEAISKVDYHAIKNQSHKLKSSAIMMGISRMEKIFLDMEMLAASNHNIEKIQDYMNELNVIIRKVLEEITYMK